jgi:GNAT superfamily N-acetyltransferase
MGANTIRVRNRTAQDLQTCGAILRRVHELDGYPVEGVTDTDAWLNPTTLTKAWVATLDHEIVGHSLLTSPTEHDDAARLWQEQSGIPLAAITVLGRLFVDPLARGHNAGSHLMKAALQYATRHRLTAVLDVMEKDDAAIRLYERAGWRQIGEARHTFGANQSVRALCYVAPL